MKKVIVIDDSLEMRKIIIKVLGEIDDLTVVDETEDVKDSITSIKKNKPDIIILDYQLKTGTGIDILKFIKDNDINLKVIFFSQFNDYRYKELAINNGADVYLEKSIEIEKFTKAVKNYL